MSFFDDLMQAPLRSKAYAESGDDFDKEMNAAMKDFDESEGDGFDPDDLANMLGEDYTADPTDNAADLGPEEAAIDAELNNLENEVESEGGDPVSSDLTEEPVDRSVAPAGVLDPTPAAPLVGEEDEKADRELAIIGTPILLNETMTVQEAADFITSGDADTAVNEGWLMEDAITEMIANLNSSETQEYTEGVFAPESRPYKMTRKARFNQLFELSLQIEARAHHDPYVPKIEKAYKIERTIKKGWRKRYGKQAARRALKYLKNIQRSKASGLAKAAKAIMPIKK